MNKTTEEEISEEIRCEKELMGQVISREEAKKQIIERGDPKEFFIGTEGFDDEFPVGLEED